MQRASGITARLRKIGRVFREGEWLRQESGEKPARNRRAISLCWSGQPVGKWLGEDHPGWLSVEDSQLVCRLTPIVCVDILPVRKDADGLEVGLIVRGDYEGGEGYAVVGGRVLRGETLNEAVTRQVRETLGEQVSWDGDFDRRPPDMVLQYFPWEKEGFFGRDPSKHSVGLTWLVEVTGEAETGGEATDFRWFRSNELPRRSAIAFGQWRLGEQLLDVRLGD